MKTAAKEILQALNTQTEPRYASWLINRNWKRLGLYNVDELVAEFLAPMEKAGLHCSKQSAHRCKWFRHESGRSWNGTGACNGTQRVSAGAMRISEAWGWRVE